jgi:uncharacterized protein YgbK (DUF1537 family)
MPHFTFVADDLTGASDVLAQAHRYGLNAVLVMGDAPLPENADVVGIAGPARSLGGAAFDDLVRADLQRIAAVDSDVLLYKVCSTFDSSPTMGSIGRGIELLHEQFPGHGPIPVAPAQPSFGRYTAFSEHYATYSGEVYRLDRHPVMSQHPSTPMQEADLRKVLASQLHNDTPIGAVHLPAYDAGAFAQSWTRHRGAAGMPAFVVDAASDAHLDIIAEALRHTAESGSHIGSRTPEIVVGSGGIMAALARTITLTTTGAELLPAPPSPASGPVLAVSASASSVTSAQLQDAIDHGWIDIPVESGLLLRDDPAGISKLLEEVSSALGAGHHVVVHTTRGGSDPRYASTGPLDAKYIGTLLGDLAAQMAQRGLTSDIAVLGGDTSSHALSAMGVRELRVTGQFVTAAPICRSDDDAAVAGCRLVLKGGQVGPTDMLRRFAGTSVASTASSSS